MTKTSPGTRLPSELRKALREEAFKRGQEKEGKEPSWGSLLWEAWQIAHRPDMVPESPGTNSDKSPSSATIPVGDKGRSWGGNLQVHEELEFILTQGPEDMAKDIVGNIHWFVVAAKAVFRDTARAEVPGAPKGPIDDHAAGLREAAKLEHEHLEGPGDTSKDAGRKGPGKKKTG